MASILQRLSRYVKMYVWRKAYDAGYSIRRNEENAFPDQVRLLRSIEVSTIFDLGANGGDVIVEYRKLFSKANIHAFEPLPDMLDLLGKRFANDSRVHVQPFAVADTEGTAEFNINAKSDTSSLLKTDLGNVPESYHSVQRTERTIEVAITTIDSFCAKNAIDQIDILKIDIQGAEYAALQGAARMLSEHRIGIIYTEAFLLPFYSNQPLLGDLARLLGEHGYKIHNLYNVSFSGGSGRCTWMDVIFVSPKFSSISRELLVEDVTN